MLEESKADRVTVLLSTFNGSQYLQQQLASLYEQTYRDIKILVRDDGSSDSTRAILESEQSLGRLTILEGHNNLGPALSFFQLLKKAATTETKYVAFCDQDDVWLPEKIARAVAKLNKVEDDRPAMYCARVELVDEDLAHIGYSALPKKIGFGNALVNSVATGCTIVLNRQAVDLIAAHLPGKIYIHDWWCYLVVSCFGDVIFDDVAVLKYRQHRHNAIGVAAGRLAQWTRKYRRFFGDGGGHLWTSEQAIALQELFGESIPSSQTLVLNKFVGAKASFSLRLQLALTREIWRQKWTDDLMLRLLILLNRF